MYELIDVSDEHPPGAQLIQVLAGQVGTEAYQVTLEDRKTVSPDNPTSP